MVAVLVVRVLQDLLLVFVFVLRLCKLAVVLVLVYLLGCHTMEELSLRLQE